jgi:ABC-2 type transport system ATP-binding protein
MLALSVTNLKKVYNHKLVALKGINLEVQEGDFFALLGQNGAGKSTTIGILCSLVNKTSGKISVFGYDIDTHWEEAKSCIGVVPQELNFNPFEKVSDILINQAGYYGIPRKIAKGRADYYLEKLGIYDKRNNAAMRLSGGMKRRLMIARALMNEPKLLILDEPTAGVDIELRHSLWAFLTELNQKGTTIILTTHYLEEAEKLCKNVAIIDHGEIIENADMKSLINRLHIQTVIFDLAEPIKSLPILPGYSHRMLDDYTFEVDVHKAQSINILFEAFSAEGLTIIGVRNKTNRLEELFVDLVAKNKVKNA